MEFPAIIAIATPPALGAVGILRLSGDGVLQIVDRFFCADSGKPLSAHPPRTMVLGTLQDQQSRPLDRILAVWFPHGRSYTGEQMAELHTHGSPAILQSILTFFINQGVAMARPGEFTRRAFLNGRVTLTQAEAVSDLVYADSDHAVQNALGQLSGVLSRSISDARHTLLALAAHFSAWLDYVEEGVEPPDFADSRRILEEVRQSLAQMADSYSCGKVVREGVPTAIIGKPNVGKSSLLNLLCGHEKAIVTDIPGTTRDIVEEYVQIDGIKLRLLDTAGLRQCGDAVEQIGIARAKDAAREAQLLLAVFDTSRPQTEEDVAIVELLHDKNAICIANKCDLPAKMDFSVLGGRATVALSAATGEGLTALTAAIAEALSGQMPVFDGTVITSLRQQQCLCATTAALAAVVTAFDEGQTPDVLLTDLMTAIETLGEINGESVTEDMIAKIFENFCVGK